MTRFSLVLMLPSGVVVVSGARGKMYQRHSQLLKNPDKQKKYSTISLDLVTHINQLTIRLSYLMTNFSFLLVINLVPFCPRPVATTSTDAVFCLLIKLLSILVKCGRQAGGTFGPCACSPSENIFLDQNKTFLFYSILCDDLCSAVT